MKEIGAIALFLALLIFVFVWQEKNAKNFASYVIAMLILFLLAYILLW